MRARQAKIAHDYILNFCDSYAVFGYCGAKLHIGQFIWFKTNYELSDYTTSIVMASGRFPQEVISSKRRLELLSEWVDQVEGEPTV